MPLRSYLASGNEGNVISLSELINVLSELINVLPELIKILSKPA